MVTPDKMKSVTAQVPDTLFIELASGKSYRVSLAESMTGVPGFNALQTRPCLPRQGWMILAGRSNGLAAFRWLLSGCIKWGKSRPERLTLSLNSGRGWIGTTCFLAPFLQRLGCHAGQLANTARARGLSPGS